MSPRGSHKQALRSTKVGAHNSPSTLRAPLFRQLAVTTNFLLQQASNLLAHHQSSNDPRFHAGMFKMFSESPNSAPFNVAASETVSDLRLRAAILDKNKQKLVGVDAVQKFLSTAFSENRKYPKMVIIPENRKIENM